MKQFIFTVFLSLLLTSLTITVQAQSLGAADVYPVLKSYKSATSFKFFGCVDGNCLDGSGTFMLVYSNNFHMATGENESHSARVFLWKGNFSGSGKQFQGRSYEVSTTYEGNKERESSKFSPKEKFDFSNEESLKQYMTAEGGAIKVAGEDVYNPIERYVNDGYVKDHVRRKWAETFKTYEGIYKSGIPEKVNITYTPNDVINKYTGSVAFTGEFLLGRAEYADGSHYDGAFFRNQFYGPGIYYGADGKKLQGIWQDGVLITPKEIMLPEHLFTLQPVAPQTGTSINVNLGSKDYSGTYTGDIKNGKPEGFGFFTMKDGFYYGGFTGGKLHGVGYFYTCTDAEEKQTDKTDKFEQLRTGSFTNGWLTNGTIITNKIEQKNGEEGPFKNGYTRLSRGTFVKHSLEGCGLYNEVNHKQDSYDFEIEGFFLNGYPAGWGNVKTHRNNRSLKSGLQYIQHGQYQSIYSMYFYDSIASAERIYMKVAQDTLTRCAGTQEERTAYLAEMRNVIENMKKELALKKAQSAARAAAEAKCKALASRARFQPNTIISKNGRDAMLINYDCEKDEYLIMWITNTTPFGDNYATVSAVEIYGFTQSSNRYHTCFECQGKGGKTQIDEISTTKELPFGYFSGYRTTITKTVKEARWHDCSRCKGSGYIKE